MDTTPQGELDWQLPKNTCKPHNLTNSDEPNLTTANSFALLDNHSATNEAPTKTTSSKKIIITLFASAASTNIKDLIKIIGDTTTDESLYRLNHPAGSEFITITTSDVSNITAFKDKLTSKNIHLYSHTPRHLKPKSMVLKGITGGFEAEDITKELNKKKPPSITILKVIPAYYTRNTPRKDFIVQIEHNNKIADSVKIKFVALQTARWEPLRKQKLFQCKRCQRFGHAKINCLLPRRCVQCSQDHDPEHCSLTADDKKDSLQCANCGEKGHPANYRVCPYYKHSLKVIKRLNPPSNTNPKNESSPRTWAPSRQVNNNVSYARMVNLHHHQTQQTQQPHHQTNPPSQFVHHRPIQQQQLQQQQQQFSNSTTPPWLNELKEAIVNEMTIMMQSIRQELHLRIDRLTEEVKYINY